MTRNILIFLATFVAGGLIALVTRAALFNPHVGHEGHPAAGGDYTPMVANPLSPSTQPPAKPSAESSTTPLTSTAPAVSDPHAGHGAVSAPTTSATTTAAADQPVNTICAICGMAVDPTLPTAQYQGKTIGFGCKICPAKFKADPDRYGPLYLKNEVSKR